ncbi:MAG: ABC transporter permease [bacterium]|nr:ABC transporter permease [bacterium]
MTRNLLKLWAFLRRDFLSEASYRLAFLLRVAGMLLSLVAFYFMTQMMNVDTPGLNGIPPFDYILVGLAFLSYFSTALYSFSAKIRSEQLLGTLEAMLVSPTPTSMVIFSSSAWDFTYGAVRLLLTMVFAVVLFGVKLNVNSPGALLLGAVLTLLSSAGLGILSASFILYFKRGDPINFLLSGATSLLGGVFFPVELLPEWLRGMSEYVPLARSLNVVRGSLLRGDGFAELQSDLIWLSLLTLVLLPAGLFCSRFAIRKAKREGALIQY